MYAWKNYSPGMCSAIPRGSRGFLIVLGLGCDISNTVLMLDRIPFDVVRKTSRKFRC